jgi:hypothetical protein
LQIQRNNNISDSRQRLKGNLNLIETRKGKKSLNHHYNSSNIYSLTTQFKIASRRAQWFTCVTPATRKAEIGRITVQGQLRQKVSKTTSQ